MTNSNDIENKMTTLESKTKGIVDTRVIGTVSDHLYVATLSQRLTTRYGKGYTYSALTRMMKVARVYNDREMFATVSQTLSWSQCRELITISDASKRLFYQPFCQINSGLLIS